MLLQTAAIASSGTVRKTMSDASTTRCASPRERLATPAPAWPARESASDSPRPTRPSPMKPSRSVAIRGILPVERAQQRRPLEEPVAAARLLRVALYMRVGGALVVERDLHARERLGSVRHHLVTGAMRRPVAREDLHLDTAGLLEPVDQVERLGNARRADQKPVVAQDHRTLVAKMRDQPPLFAAVEGRSFVVVIREVAVKAHRRLRKR